MLCRCWPLDIFRIHDCTGLRPDMLFKLFWLNYTNHLRWRDDGYSIPERSAKLLRPDNQAPSPTANCGGGVPR
jgi:hypothetical protein